MKNIMMILPCLFWVLLGNAQTEGRPYWIANLPATKENSKYYYRVTQGDGTDYDKAYAKAFARAIMESSWKLGLEVNTNDDLQTIEHGIAENVKVAPSHMNLPMNKVCEYTENLFDTRGVRVFVLWQVAKYGNRDPQFDDFTKCR
ncbi:MAG: hypothetical protein J5606_02590 [Bacteroidales bacterium]|nr:hypothetical protein [Bacteroidales bacterium]